MSGLPSGSVSCCSPLQRIDSYFKSVPKECSQSQMYIETVFFSAVSCGQTKHKEIPFKALSFEVVRDKIHSPQLC